MSASLKRRKPKLLGAIMADPYRKLAAITLAVGLWYFLDMQAKESHPITATLETSAKQTGISHRIRVHLDDALVIGRFELAQVKLTLSGPKAEIDRVKTINAIVFDVRFDVTDWETRTEIEFTARDLQRPTSLSSNIEIKLEPARVRLALEHKTETSIAVTLDDVKITADEEIENDLILNSAKFEPAMARITGTAPEIAVFEQHYVRNPDQKRFTAHFTSGRGDRQAPAPLKLAATQFNLRIEPIRMVVDVRRAVMTFEAAIPLFVDHTLLPSDLKYRPNEDKQYWAVSISVSGKLRTRLTGRKEAELDTWAKRHLRLHMLLEPPSAEPQPVMVVETTLHLVGPLCRTIDQDNYVIAQQPSITLSQQQ